MDWQLINRLRVPEERKAKRRCKAALKESEAEFIKAIRNAETQSDLLRAASHKLDTVPVEKALVETYKTTGTKFAKLTRSKLKQTKGIDEDFLREFQSQMSNYAKLKAGKRIVDITATTHDEIERITAKVINEAAEDGGWGITKMAKQIEKYLNISNFYRAERIARTEVLAASNEGSILGADSLGIEYKKEWISTNDTRTRDSHRGFNQVVEKYERFTLPSGARLEYPGDPNGSAEEVINCRCTIGYVVD